MTDWLFDYKFVLLFIAAAGCAAVVVGCRSGAPSPGDDQPAAASAGGDDASGGEEADESSGGGALDEGDLEPLDARATFGGHIELPFDSQVIEDQQSFDALVEHIPKNKVQKKMPAPPNDDPILDEPEIDFDAEVVLLAVCPTYYCQLEFVGVRRDDDGYVVSVNLPGEGEKAEYHARPANVGNYRAVVVRRFDDAVRLEVGGETAP
jgi:hypothetical protein